MTEFPSTLPPAPIARLEDLTKEVLDSALESSRRFVADERKEYTEEFVADERKERTGATNRNVRQSKFHSLIEPIGGYHAVKSNRQVLYSTPNIKSYSGPLDDYLCPPTMTSARISSVSETFHSQLTKGTESEWEEYRGWEEHAFAMDIGNVEEDYDYDYDVYAEEVPQIYSEAVSEAGESSGWSW
eukprot:jgi/Psemu1/303837/fgenesh1_kg.125_\